eukprot:TRINITY_DN12156_c0_g1_i1.p1 TRINITY_DN12156_c0_g1~~TRINITY_DN12156_c0_g1_i1.p1  ORF type:complete len:437 (+),score=169.33 TRINITY_DN12156_c0_g1_i1:153-1463(+)
MASKKTKHPAGHHSKVRPVQEGCYEEDSASRQLASLAKQLEKEKAECEQWRLEALQALAKVKENDEVQRPPREAGGDRCSALRVEELEQELDALRKELSKRDRLHEAALQKERERSRKAKADAVAVAEEERRQVEKRAARLEVDVVGLRSEVRELKKERVSSASAQHQSTNTDAFLRSLSESRCSEIEELRLELREWKARAKEFERKFTKAEEQRMQLLDELAQRNVQKSKRSSREDPLPHQELAALAEERLEQIRLLQSDRRQLLSQLEQQERDSQKLRVELCGSDDAPGESSAWYASEGESEEEAQSVQAASMQEMFELPSGETLVTYFACATNDGRRGYIYLTQSFVCFAVLMAHLRDIPRHVIPLGSIERIEVLNTRWIRIPGRGRAIRMVLSSGEKLTFRGFLLRAAAVAAIRDQAMKLAHMIVVKENVDE